MKRGESFRRNKRVEGGSKPAKRGQRELARFCGPLIGSATAAVQLEHLEPRRLLAGAYHWPLGAEMHANSYTTGEQSAPSMAMDADGDFVIAWTSAYQDGSSTGVYAQRYNAAGLPQGDEFRVNTTTIDAQHNPTVAMDADGEFVVAWVSSLVGYYGGLYDGDVYAQRYNASGVAQGTEFLVNTYTTANQFAPSIAMDADGDFVVAWTSSGGQDGSDGVYAHRYSAAGVEQGSAFRINSYTLGGQWDNPSVAMDDDGNFVVTWSSYQDGSGLGIYAQRYNAAGATQGTEFRVNSYTNNHQQHPSAAMDADGDFVVTWTSDNQDGSFFGIYAQRYNAAGAPQGTEFRVNSYTTSQQLSPSTAMDAEGDFVVAWNGVGQGADWGSFAQRYNAAGVKQGTEFRVNTYTNSGYNPSAAMDADGDFAVTWQSYLQDGNSWGIYVQRYQTFGPTTAATIGDRVWNDSNANGIQDGGESSGIAGAGVELYSASGAGVGSLSTSPSGLYSFPVLAGASAFLHFAAPTGFLPTHKDRGANDELDSDADRVTGLIPIFTAGAAGTTNISFDAGFALPGSVGGVAFFDRSGDGIRNGGEEALAGFQAFLDLDADGMPDPNEPTATTNFDGSYTFGNLLGDTYRVGIVDQVQWIEPAELPFLVVPGATSPINLPLLTSAHDSISAAAGSEFRANSTTNGLQYLPSTAMDSDGDFVVAWSGEGQGDDFGIFAQRYNAAGVKQGTEFRVNTYTTNSQVNPSAVMEADGDFTVTWQSYLQDGSSWGIYAQRYNAAGVKIGTEFRVNSYTLGDQREPAAAMDSDGDFVVTWQSHGQEGGYGSIYAQRYSAAGMPQGGEFRVNADQSLNNVTPTIAMDADGDFVVAWTSGLDTYYIVVPDNVHAQRYNAAGVPQGAEFRVTAFEGLYQREPSIAMANNGDFVIAWQSPYSSNWDILARRFGATGVPQGTEFLVNTLVTGPQTNPSAAMDADGDFVITWSGGATWCDFFAQRYNAAGLKQGAEFRVNSFTRNYQSAPSAAMDDNGNFVITWWGVRSQDQDSGVLAQRYSVSQRPAITASQFVWQTAPQRIEFTFDQDVSASLSASDLVLTNLTTGATIPTGSIVRSWNAATKTATFTFPNLPNGGSLSDGTYRATLPAGSVSNTSGTTIAVDYALQFFFLAGDANHDGRVTLQDFNILAANFGQSQRDFTQGDFNYDTIVNLSDFNILAARFGAALAAQAADPPPPLSLVPFSRWSLLSLQESDENDPFLDVKQIE